MTDDGDVRCIQEYTLDGGCYGRMFECARRVYSPDGLVNTINVCGG